MEKVANKVVDEGFENSSQRRCVNLMGLGIARNSEPRVRNRALDLEF